MKNIASIKTKRLALDRFSRSNMFDQPSLKRDVNGDTLLLWSEKRLQKEFFIMIVTAIQKGNSVYVYGESNRLLFTQSGELHGYTGSSVSIKKGNMIYCYNERSSLISTHTAR